MEPLNSVKKKNLLDLFLCLWVFCLYVYLCGMFVPGALKSDPKWMLELLEL